MSTKLTIASGDNFHFYEEAFDGYSRYLKLNLDHTSVCEMTPTEVTIKIPADVWSVILGTEDNSYSWAKKTDDEIRAFAEGNVDERVLAIASGSSPILGMLIYGSADLSRDAMVENAISYYCQKRSREERIVDLIEQHKRLG